MDSNIMTISNILLQTNATSPISSNLELSDVKKDNSRFLVGQEKEPVNYKNVRSETTDNSREIRSAENDRFAIGNEKNAESVNPGNLDKTKNSIKSEKKESSKSNEDDNSTNPENKITLGSLVREAARNNEPGGGRQLSQLINSFKENRVLPVTAKATKTENNKQQLKTDDKKTGIKTILLEKLEGRITLKNDLQTGSVSALRNNSSGKNPTVSTMSSMDMKTTTSNLGNSIKTGIFKENNPEKATQFDKQQMDSLKIKKGISENEINNTTKSQTNSLQSVNNASEIRHKISDNGIEKSMSNKNKPNDEENLEPRRIKEFSAVKGISQHVKDSVNGSNNEKQTIINAHVSSEQVRIKNHSTTDDMDGKVVQDNIKPVVVDQSVSADENHVRSNNFTKPGTSSEAPDTIGKQILESMHSSLSRQGTDKQISVRLNPPELGKVFIKFHEQDNQITGLLEVSKTQTRTEIEHILPQIVRHLSDSGVNIKRLEVVLADSDQAEQETLKDNSFFSNQQQHHDFGDSGLYGGDQDISGIHEWMANNISFENDFGLRDALAANSSINILI